MHAWWVRTGDYADLDRQPIRFSRLRLLQLEVDLTALRIVLPGAAQLGHSWTFEPLVEEPPQIGPRDLFHHLPKVVRRGVQIPITAVIGADAFPEAVGAEQTAQHVQHPSAFLIDEPVEDTTHVADVPVNDRLLRRLQLCFRNGVDVVSQCANECIAPAELFRIEMREIGGKSLTQPDIVPVTLGHGVAPPLVRDLVNDGRPAAGDPFVAVEDGSGMFRPATQARGLHVPEFFVRVRPHPIAEVLEGAASRELEQLARSVAVLGKRPYLLRNATYDRVVMY